MMNVGNKKCPNTPVFFCRSEQESNDDANESNTIRIHRYFHESKRVNGKVGAWKREGNEVGDRGKIEFH